MRRLCGHAVCLGEICQKCKACMLSHQDELTAANCTSAGEMQFCGSSGPDSTAIWKSEQTLPYLGAGQVPAFSAPAADAERGIIATAVNQFAGDVGGQPTYVALVKGYNATNGKELWCVPEPCGLSAGVTASSGAVLFASSRTEGLRARTTNIYAVDALTGAVLWARE
eukprot:gene935-11441_t